MDQDIYKPPQADLILPSTEPAFYVVSPRKFLILIISTMGLYLTYWFYKHWRQQKLKHNENIWPVARTIFALFFTPALFNRIRGVLIDAGKKFQWSNQLIALYIVFSIFHNVSTQLSSKAPGDVTLIVMNLLTLIPMIFATYKAQQNANIACDDPQGEQNNTITPVNIIWILLGILLWTAPLSEFYNLL